LRTETELKEINTGSEAPLVRVDILGVPIDRVNMEDAVRRVRLFMGEERPHMIVTADSAGVVIAQHDPQLLSIMRAADLITPDSAGILLAARLLGTPLKERVCGIDLAQHLCEVCAEMEASVFLLGAAPGVADAAATNLVRKYPGLRIAGTLDGFFTDDASVVEQVRKSGASVLFAAMGIPKQEKWVSAHLRELGVKVAIGLGGSFDVFSGNVQRAPAWMRNHGMEWLHRLISNPKKITKVAHLPRFAVMALQERLGLRRRRK
jgi:N-acetylglucosaminyldiphosphoundecaprenol N-acetyl-beta-D-mannosaminyltransferase